MALQFPNKIDVHGAPFWTPDMIIVGRRRPTSSNLLAYWPLDEGSGSSVTADIPSGATGNLTGNYSWTSGRLVVGGTGSSGVLTFPSALTTAGMSEVWLSGCMRAPSASTQADVFIETTSSAGFARLSIIVPGTTLTPQVRGREATQEPEGSPQSLTSGTAITANTWTLVTAGWKAGAGLSIRVGTGTATTSSIPTLGSLGTTSTAGITSGRAVGGTTDRRTIRIANFRLLNREPTSGELIAWAAECASL